jgi:hypothetical protein
VSGDLFNEDVLRENVAKVWGDHGAHVEVLDELIRRARRASAHPPVEPLWTGKTQDPVQASDNIDLAGRGWSILQLLVAVEPGTEVAVVPWPIPAVTREQVWAAVYQDELDRASDANAITDRIMALLSGQATEEETC